MLLNRIAFRIDGDIDKIHLVGLIAQQGLDLFELRQGDRANIRAVGITKKDQHQLCLLVAQPEGLAILVGQGEIGGQRRRVDQ